MIWRSVVFRMVMVFTIIGYTKARRSRVAVSNDKEIQSLQKRESGMYRDIERYQARRSGVVVSTERCTAEWSTGSARYSVRRSGVAVFMKTASARRDGIAVDIRRKELTS
ncbi:hypothetical protein P5V15_013807 [Pogonomyrmex californicus]